MKNILTIILFLFFPIVIITAQEVFKNDEVTISVLEDRTWVLETFDRTTMYILEGDDRAMLIDTGTQCEDLDEIVRKITQKPLTVVLTHNHRDHAGNIRYFDEVYMHPADTLVPIYVEFDGEYKWMREGDIFDLGNRKIEVFRMPGHTPGSVVFVDRNINASYTGDAFGSGQVWLQLLPQVAMTDYYEACVRMERLMNEQNITKLYVGHYPHVKAALGIDYIKKMKNLSWRLSNGDTEGAEDFPNMGLDISCENPMIIADGQVMIVFDPENINYSLKYIK